jgi:formylglycine-generating enzyme required for sulfatase activity
LSDLGKIEWLEKGYRFGLSIFYIYPGIIGKESEPNVLGIYDLCGNVAEACQDAEDSNYDYPYRILKGGACVSTDRSVFGGSAQDPMRAYHPAYRDRVYQDDRIEWLGFRLVLDK